MEAEIEDPMRWEARLHDPVSVKTEVKDIDRKPRIASRTAEGGRAMIEDSRTKRWNEALEEGNCVKLKGLLIEDGDLIYEGWKAAVQGPDQNPPICRTALHVAARRGDKKLVRRIMKLKLNFLLNVKDVDYELDALAMAVINGRQDIVDLIIRSDSSEVGDVDQFSEDEDQFSEEEDALRNIIKKVLDKISSAQEIKPKFDEYLEREDREREVKDGARKSSRETERAKGSDQKFYSRRDGESASSHEAGETSTDSKKNEDLNPACQNPLFDRKELFYSWYRQIINYDENCDFNFLDFYLFFFHFSFTESFDGISTSYAIRKKIVVASNQKCLRCLLFALKDGQGRTPFHVAVDNDSVLYFPIHLIVSKGLDEKKILNVRDSAGRTPLHRAIGTEAHLGWWHIILLLKNGDVNETLQYGSDQWGTGLDVNELSSKNGFKSDALWPADGGQTSSTALHLAIIHKLDRHIPYVSRTLAPIKRCYCSRQFTWPRQFLRPGTGPQTEDAFERSYHMSDGISDIQLAVLTDSASTVGSLLKVFSTIREDDSPVSREKYLPSTHLAAAMRNPAMIKDFVDSNNRQFDQCTTDIKKNTALHYAMLRGPATIHPHLLDFVSCEHVRRWRRKNHAEISRLQATSQAEGELSKQGKINEEYGQRKGCIISLLQAGVDIWARNFDGRVARPEPDAPEDFVTWWYEKVAQETDKVQQNLNAGANAISVTAALVATTSYVGPLQPPLGYGGDPSSVQVQSLPVRIFIICDTLSFYLALAAIMLALLPSLPQPQQSIFKVLKRTRTLVALAVSCLFPSIICVLLAFSASSIAVVPEHGLSHHGIIVATTVVGGFICFLVIGWFAYGLLNVLRTLPIIKSIVEFTGKRTRQLIKVIGAFPRRIRVTVVSVCFRPRP